MTTKIFILLLIAINCYTTSAATLRRTPKVYNALITTDENLTSSRAFPVIQPTLHETGIAHYPFGPYSPYEYYAQPLVRFGQPIAPGLGPREQLSFSHPQQRFPPQELQQQPQPYPGYPQNPPNPPIEQQNPEQESAEPSDQDPKEQKPVKATPTQPEPLQQKNPQQMPKEKLPIPLNAYGLPPALIPFQQYPSNQRSPVQIPPYSYNQYPLVYDPITGFREQYIPPYDYFPSHGYPFGSSPQQQQHPQQQQPQPQLPPQFQQPQLSQQPQEYQYPQPPQQPQQTQPQQPFPQPTSSTAITQPPSPSTYDTPSPYSEETTINETTDVTAQTPSMTTNFEAIKNVSKNKNRNVPDVPPPPIPSGAKTKQG